MAWISSEIKEYQKIRHKELGQVYAAAGIPMDDPEKRAEYLANLTKIGMTDHDLIMRTAKKEGMARALYDLEEIAIAMFF